MTNQQADPLASPTVQAAILQAERMAHLESGIETNVADVQRLREEIREKLDKILTQTTATNGSVAKVMRAQEEARANAASLAEGVGQAKSLAADASGEVAALGAEVDAIKQTRHDGDLVAKTRWEVVRAELKFVAMGYAAAGGTAGVIGAALKLLDQI